MKRIYFFLFSITLLISECVLAKQLVIGYSITDKKFSPEITEANIGDTIIFRPLEALGPQDSVLITGYPTPISAGKLEKKVTASDPEYIYICQVYGTIPLSNYYISEMVGTLKILRPEKQAWICVWGTYQMFKQVSDEYQVGDTVIWRPYTTREFGGNRGSHTITSTSIPKGAAPFDGVYNSTDTIFKYVLTKPGKYFYECTPHSHHMQDSFIVAEPITSAATRALEKSITISPNPFDDKISLANISMSHSYTLEVFSILGDKIFEKTVINVNHETLDLSKLISGVYILRITSEGKERTERIIKL